MNETELERKRIQVSEMLQKHYLEIGNGFLESPGSPFEVAPPNGRFDIT